MIVIETVLLFADPVAPKLVTFLSLDRVMVLVSSNLVQRLARGIYSLCFLYYVRDVWKGSSDGSEIRGKASLVTQVDKMTLRSKSEFDTVGIVFVTGKAFSFLERLVVVTSLVRKASI